MRICFWNDIDVLIDKCWGDSDYDVVYKFIVIVFFEGMEKVGKNV